MRCPPGWTGLFVAIGLLLWIAIIEYAEHGVGRNSPVSTSESALEAFSHRLRAELDKYRGQLLTLRSAILTQPALAGEAFKDLSYALQADHPAVRTALVFHPDETHNDDNRIASELYTQAVQLYQRLQTNPAITTQKVIGTTLKLAGSEGLLILTDIPEPAPLAIALYLDLDSLLAQAAITSLAQHHHLALYSDAPDQQRLYRLFGDEEQLGDRALTRSVQFLGQNWRLQAAERQPAHSGLNWLLSLLLALLGGLIAYYYARSKERIRYLALHDVLTGLPNKRLLQDRVNQAQMAALRSSKVSIFMYLDLDNFKPINDQHGHKMGDCALREVAKRLNACVRKSDTVARISGDEFAVVLSRLHHRHEAIQIADKIQRAINQPLSINGKQAKLGVSIGLYALDQPEPFDTVLARADAAMYAAKHNGKHTYTWYNSSGAIQLSFGDMALDDEGQQA